MAAAKTEDLGTQVMQGVSAQGKRVTRAIPAGKEGNEKEIDIVTETWYSPDLQVVVMSKTSDPRFGESVYQLNGHAPRGARSSAVRRSIRLHGEGRAANGTANGTNDEARPGSSIAASSTTAKLYYG